MDLRQCQKKENRNDLLNEILFLEKLKKCKRVIKAFDYELVDTRLESVLYVLMELGQRDLGSIFQELRDDKAMTPAKLR